MINYHLIIALSLMIDIVCDLDIQLSFEKSEKYLNSELLFNFKIFVHDKKR
jgi:hypothetical protein